MSSSICLFTLSLISLQFLVLTVSQPTMLYKDCVKNGNYTSNSTYQANLNHLLTSIYTNTEIDNGFYNISYGENPDKVSAIGLCRPDVSPDACRACIKNASDSLLTSCPNFKEAIGGFDNCMLRYSNRFIFSLMEWGPYFWVYGLKNVSDVTGFNQSRTALLDKLSNQAASGNSSYKYATGQTGAPNSQTIYALVQCTPDLSKHQCMDCLAKATGLIPECCNVRQGGRVITPSCNFRYEIDLFYVPEAKMTTSLPTSPSPQPISASSRTGRTSNIAGTLIIGSLPLLLF